MDILGVQRWTCGGNGRVSSALLAEQIGGRGLVYREVRGVQPSSNPHLSQVQEGGTVYKTASTRRLARHKPDSKVRLGPRGNEGPCSWSAHTAAMRLAAGIDIDGGGG